MYTMKKIRRRLFILGGGFCLLAAASLFMLLSQRSKASVLKMDTCMQEEFRMQQLQPELYEEIQKTQGKEGDFGDILTTTMLHGKFFPQELWTDNSPYVKYKKEEYLLLKECYEAIWADLVYFPVPSREISFEDGWRKPRDYGGERLHEGTDLFGKVEEAGYYPVVSMTDGVVEQKGWLPLGGYRIGIRSPHGGYFYYAHLSEYEGDISTGDTVTAGDVLGYMGNTGYGPEETKGKFPVHLHLGIYISTPYQEEVSVNPYWVLKAMEKKIRNYTY